MLMHLITPLSFLPELLCIIGHNCAPLLTVLVVIFASKRRNSSLCGIVSKSMFLYWSTFFETADHFETDTGGKEGGRGRYCKRHKKQHIETNKYNIKGTQERKQMFFKVLSMDTTFLIPWADFSLHSKKAQIH